MKSCISTLFLIFSVVVFGFSQSEKLSDKKILAKKINENIKLDGELNESFWKDAEIKSNFFQYSPRDSISAILDSEFRIAYDDKYLYLAAKMEDIPEKKFIVGDLKRDFWGGSTDLRISQMLIILECLLMAFKERL